MKVFSVNLILILMFFGGKVEGQLLDELTKKWENAAAYTLEVAHLMPLENYNFQPAKEVMTFGEQLLHITFNMNWLGNRYLNANLHSIDSFNGITEKDLIIKILDEGFNNALQAMRSLALEELDDEVDFFAGSLTKRQIIHLMHDHLTHHRGQLIIYLRMRGIEPPRYIGW